MLFEIPNIKFDTSTPLHPIRFYDEQKIANSTKAMGFVFDTNIMREISQTYWLSNKF